MLRILIIALLKDLQHLIQQNIFLLSGKERRSNIQKILGKNYPETFVHYFATIEHERLSKDSIKFIKFVSTGRFSTTDFDLFRLLQAYIVQELPSLETSKLEETRSVFLTAAVSLRNQGQHEFEKNITRFAERFPGVSGIRIQTALPLPVEEKNSIRKHFCQNDRVYHIVFSTDASLLGGMRIFKDGALLDNSWARHIGSHASLS